MRTLLLATVFLAGTFTAAGADNAAAKRTVLFNGRDLTGWRVFLKEPAADAKSVWSAVDGVLRLTGKPTGSVRTEATFAADYHLHLEWRWPEKPGNSGVIIHTNGPDAVWPAAFECQLQSEHAGDIIALNTEMDGPTVNNRKRLLVTEPPLEKKPGEWNSYDIYTRGDTIETIINGTHRNLAKKISATSGSILLQLEGAPIEFRDLWLEKL
jgi:hypothetical protein